MQPDYFTLFNLEPEYLVDLSSVEQNFKSLQKQFHPDRYAHKTEAEQKLALHYTALINEAFAVLSSPIKRAEYLLQLKGCNTEEHTMKTDTDFLFQQMQWRESLDQAESQLTLSTLQDETNIAFDECEQKLNQAFLQNDFSSAQANVDKLQFISKFQTELLRAQSQMAH